MAEYIKTRGVHPYRLLKADHIMKSCRNSADKSGHPWTDLNWHAHFNSVEHNIPHLKSVSVSLPNGHRFKTGLIEERLKHLKGRKKSSENTFFHFPTINEISQTEVQLITSLSRSESEN